MKIKGFNIGRRVYLDPRLLPDMRIITDLEAKAIAAESDKRRFIITAIE
jgi:hypothetical protein